MAVKHYSPKDIVIVLGEIIVEGYADGDFVEIDQTEDDFSLYVGADGKGTRALNASEAATITFTLSQSSKTNELLSILRALDKATGAGVRPVMVKDKNGTTLHSAASAWIKRGPKGTFGKQVGTRQWTIETDNLNTFHGSAGSPPSA